MFSVANARGSRYSIKMFTVNGINSNQDVLLPSVMGLITKVVDEDLTLLVDLSDRTTNFYHCQKSIPNIFGSIIGYY